MRSATDSPALPLSPIPGGPLDRHLLVQALRAGALWGTGVGITACLLTGAGDPIPFLMWGAILGAAFMVPLVALFSRA
jgi:hypothetical protein